MPWTFYDSSGRKLNTASTLIDNLDIDGATDIGAAIVDADLFIVDDGAGGTNRKTAASRIATYIGSAVARAGEEQSGQTFTNTSAGDLIDISSLTIDRAVPFVMTLAANKDATGTGNHVNIGLKINSTVIGEASVGTNNIWSPSNTDEVQEGVSWTFVGPRATNMQNSATGFRTTWAGTTRRATVFIEDPGGNTNQWEANADTTNIILRSITNDPVGGVDEFNIYTFSYGGA